jgi:ketosteroid isomerase-like protein
VEKAGVALVEAERLLAVVKEMADDAIILDADPSAFQASGDEADRLPAVSGGLGGKTL